MMSKVNVILSEDQREGTKATVSQWLYNVGDIVKQNEPIVEIETDKVMMEVIAPVDGQITEINLNTGDEVSGSAILGVIDPETMQDAPLKQNNTQIIKENSASITDIPVIKKGPDTSNQSTGKSIFISPAVRKLISQHQVNITDISGTGKQGRVTSRDIHSYLNNRTTEPATSSKHIPVTSMRKSIADHMVQSLLHTAPHVTSVFNLDMSAIITHRNKYKTEFKNKGANLTFTSYFIAASVAAIKQQPLINSQLHEDSIEIFSNINIGIGTALEDKGLIVPLLKNCESRNLFSISQQLTNLTEKARNNNLKPADVQGGTFTISNHGVSGSLIATPIIINQPQSAILGIGKMEKRVIVKEINGEDVMAIKPMCYVTLTIDHRVLDAHQCNQFLSVFVETLENWEHL